MKILNVSAQKPNSTGSGVYLTALMKALAAAGHETAVLCGVSAHEETPLPHGTAFFPVEFETPDLPFPVAGMSDEMPYKSTCYKHMTPEMTAQFRAAFTAKIKEAWEAFRPDLILCHHLYFVAALVREQLPDAKIFAVSHGTDLRQLQNTDFEREFIRRTIPRLDHIFCLHEPQMAEVMRLFAPDAAKVSVLGTGYDDSVFYRGEKPPHRETRLIYAGKISEQKGVFDLLSALPMVKCDLTVTLAGGYGNRDYETALALAAKSPHPVTFTGLLTQPVLAEKLRESDVFILPSYSEGLPLVLAEAMASGCRLICTDLPGIRPWLDGAVPGHGCRFLPRPEEGIEAFRAAIAAAITEAAADESPIPDLRNLSWHALAERVMKYA